MTLRDPIWLLALVTIPLLALLLAYSDLRARRRLRKFAAERLLKGLVRGESGWRRWARFGLCGGAIALAVVALARPQGGEKVEKLSSSGADVLFAIDTSRSMLAGDLAPNRLTRAKLAVLELLERLPGHRVGLVAFSGAAFLQCPLTLDHGAFQQALEAIDAGIIPTPGTNLAAAIAEAQEALSEGERPKILLLLTDGEDLEAAGLRQAREVEGVTVITVGVGTAEGGVVPASAESPQAGATRDASGNMVVSKLDSRTLEAIAVETGGIYVQLQPGAVEQVYQQAIAGVDGALVEQEIRTPIERFQWPLGGAICLLLLEPLMGMRRKGGVAALFLVALLAHPDASWAASEKEAYALLKAEDYEAAAEAYSALLSAGSESAENIYYNLGVAQYRAGKVLEAAKTFESAVELGGAEAGKAAYNAGTAYLKAALNAAAAPQEALPLAEAARRNLETALGQVPGSSQARENLKQAVELLEQLKRRQEQEENPQEQEEGQQGDQDREAGQEHEKEQGDQKEQQGQHGEQQQGQDEQQGEHGEQGEQGSQQESQQQEGASEEEGQQQAGREEGSNPEQQQRHGDTDSEEGAENEANAEEHGESAAQQDAGQQQQEENPYGREAEPARGDESGLEGVEEEGTSMPGSIEESEIEAEAAETIMLTREQAERLLRALQREEKMLPAGKLLEPVNRGEGRDW